MCISVSHSHGWELHEWRLSVALWTYSGVVLKWTHVLVPPCPPPPSPYSSTGPAPIRFQPLFTFMRSQVLVLQGREHAWLHAAISTAMSAAHVDALRPAIRTIATGLLEAAREQG